MPGIKDNVVGITYASSELRKFSRAGEHSPAARRGEQALGRLSGQPNRRDDADHYGKRARVMALLRRSPRPPGMPDAFDRAPLR